MNVIKFYRVNDDYALETVVQFKTVVERELIRANDTARQATETELVGFIKRCNSIFSYSSTEQAPFKTFSGSNT